MVYNTAMSNPSPDQPITLTEREALTASLVALRSVSQVLERLECRIAALRKAANIFVEAPTEQEMHDRRKAVYLRLLSSGQPVVVSKLISATKYGSDVHSRIIADLMAHNGLQASRGRRGGLHYCLPIPRLRHDPNPS